MLRLPGIQVDVGVIALADSVGTVEGSRNVQLVLEDRQASDGSTIGIET